MTDNSEKSEKASWTGKAALAGAAIGSAALAAREPRTPAPHPSSTGSRTSWLRDTRTGRDERLKRTRKSARGG